MSKMVTATLIMYNGKKLKNLQQTSLFIHIKRNLQSDKNYFMVALLTKLSLIIILINVSIIITVILLCAMAVSVSKSRSRNNYIYSV